MPNRHQGLGNTKVMQQSNKFITGGTYLCIVIHQISESFFTPFFRLKRSYSFESSRFFKDAFAIFKMFLSTVKHSYKRSFCSHPCSLKAFSSVLMHYTEFNWEIALPAEDEELKMQANQKLRIGSQCNKRPVFQFPFI